MLPVGKVSKETAMLKLGTQTGSLVNHIYSRMQSATPEVGMGATILSWTDRHPATVYEVSRSGKRVGIRDDKAIRTDGNGMSESQAYLFEPDPTSPIRYFTLRKTGEWVLEGQSLKGGRRIMIGRREKYYDYSF